VCFALEMFRAIWSDSVNAGSDSVRFGKLQDPFFSVYGHGSETLGDFKFPLKPKFLSRVSMLKPDARY